MEVVGVYRWVKPVEIPDGRYEGMLHGYDVAFETPAGEYEGTVNNGIRGRAECVVTVASGKITVELKGQSK